MNKKNLFNYMKLFNNLIEVHNYFKFPGTHRIGALSQNGLIIRIYSNSKSKPDYFNKLKTQFYYTLKSDKIKHQFLNNKKLNHFIYVFTKDLIKDKVVYHGKFKVIGLRENNKYVLLQKTH